jgi:hypothetical protein
MRKSLYYCFLLLVISCFFGCRETTSSTINLAPPPTTAPATATHKTAVPIAWAPSIDTAWVMALYREAEGFTPFAQIEEYQQFDLHHAAVVRILRHCYSPDSAFPRRLRLLERNRRAFYQATRQAVLYDYRTYHSMEGMNIEYLCARQDSLAKVLLLRLLTDKKALAGEKVYARQLLRQHYSIVR